MTTIEYSMLIVFHATALVGIAYYYRTHYKKAVRANNHCVEQLLAQQKIAELQTEIEFLAKRNAVLMQGLFPRGEVFPGNFIEDDPELRALAELLSILSSRKLLQPPYLNVSTPTAS
jgi:hypothetical protein